MLDASRCLWKVILNLVTCKRMDFAFHMWYFPLAPVPKLLAWEVGLNSLSAFHGSAVRHLCRRFGKSGALFSCLEDLED